MTVDEAVERLVAVGILRRDIVIKRVVTTEWKDAGSTKPTTSWVLHARFPATKTINQEKWCHEQAQTLDQLVERVELLYGVKKPGDDAK